MLAACQMTPQFSPSTRLKDYKKWVYAAMQTTWLAVAREHIDSLKVGQAHVTGKILPDGRVSEFKVLSNSGGETLAIVARLTVERTFIPPIPAAALAELPHGYMPGNFTFTAHEPP
jgi:hypothetical protein